MATAAMFFVSCKPQEDPVEPKLDVDNVSVALEALEGSGTFSVTSNQDWTASADKDWVSLDPPTGKASDKAVTVTVTAEDNTATEARTATVTIKAGELTKTVAVSQAAAEPPVYELDGRQWLFEWEAMAIDALLDLGVTEAGKFYIAYDMGGLDPSYADVWYPYFEGTYTVTEGEAINTGVINLVIVDPYEGTELAADMPYVLTAENAVTFDTTALEEIIGSVSVSATAATEKKELFIQSVPELPAEMDVVAVALAGEYLGNMYQEAYNYFFTVCDEEYLSSGQTTGAAIAIDLYSNVPVGDGANIVPSGEYIFDPEDTYEAGTFSNEYSYVAIDGLAVSILDGVVYVKEDRVDMELYLEGGTTLYVEYDGVPDMGKQGAGEGVGNLTEDIEIVSENGLIIAEGYGDFYEVGMDNWMISIFADGETFSGDALMFEILTDGEGIVGDYEVFYEDADELYNCFLPGEYEIEDGYMTPYCSWYLSVTEGGMDGEAYAPIVEGQLRITESEGVYTVEFDVYDDNGNNIVGSVTGDSEIYAPETEPAASMAKAQSRNGHKAASKKGFKVPARNPIVLKRK